ncbi:MAG: hypothetical protein JNM78_02865 [Cyclobacteriaceae bacterium]|nr:hypothetical protein [Cyclobacteriaceae bacterium]
MTIQYVNSELHKKKSCRSNFSRDERILPTFVGTASTPDLYRDYRDALTGPDNKSGNISL